MAERATPLDRFVDVAVFAPVGLALELRKQIPSWAKTGRAEVDNRVKLYRMIGRFVIQQGRVELIKRLDKIADERAAASVIDAASEWTSDIIVQAPSELKAPRTESATKPRKKIASADSVELTRAAPPTASGASTAASTAESPVLPIADYDSLAASQVVSRLAALSPSDLAAVLHHETVHRGRRTVLGKIAQLQAG